MTRWLDIKTSVRVVWFDIKTEDYCHKPLFLEAALCKEGQRKHTDDFLEVLILEFLDF